MADTVFIRAVLPLSVDGKAIQPGDVAEIRAELLADLVAVSAAEEIEAPPAEPAKRAGNAKAE